MHCDLTLATAMLPVNTVLETYQSSPGRRERAEENIKRGNLKIVSWSFLGTVRRSVRMQGNAHLLLLMGTAHSTVNQAFLLPERWRATSSAAPNQPLSRHQMTDNAGVLNR